MPETFRVNLFRRQTATQRNTFDTDTKTDTNTSTSTSTKTDTKTDAKDNVNTAERILMLIQSGPQITLEELARRTGLSKSGVRYALGKLRKKGIVQREGTRKDGCWVVLTKESNGTI